MARPRLFDEDQALDAAMRAFWRDGYEATSADDLCAATGLGRGSIYNTFRSKSQLFERALDRYMEDKDAAMESVLAGQGTIHERVGTLLRGAIEPPADDPAGCLVVNSMVELAPADPQVAETLRRDYERRRRALESAFGAARRAGEIDRAKDPAALAHFVIGTITTLRVMAGAGADRGALEAIAATTLAAI